MNIDMLHYLYHAHRVNTARGDQMVVGPASVNLFLFLLCSWINLHKLALHHFLKQIHTNKHTHAHTVAHTQEHTHTPGKRLLVVGGWQETANIALPSANKNSTATASVRCRSLTEPQITFVYSIFFKRPNQEWMCSADKF